MEIFVGCVETGTDLPESEEASAQVEVNSRPIPAEWELYQRLFDFAPDPCIVTDLLGKITHANQAAAALLSTPGRDLTGNGIASLITASSRREFRSALSHLLREASASGRDWRSLAAWHIRPRSGAPILVSASVGTLRGADHRAQALYWLLRPRAEPEGEPWSSGEAAAQSILHSVPVGVIETDADQRCLYTNARWQEITGMDSEQSLGYGWSRVLHPDDRDVALKEWIRAGVAGQVSTFEHRIVTPDGSMRWVCTRSRALQANGSRVTGYLASIDDITERKRSEAALHASEARFRALTERSWDAVSLIDADGTILYDNPDASTRILGYATGELVGRSALERLHPEDQPQIMDLFLQLTQVHGSSTTAEFRYQHKDGSWRWIECVGTNLLDDPSVRAIVANYRDITERKLAEQQIHRSNQELAALNAITTAVSSSLELTEVLTTFKRLIAEELDIPGGMVYFRDRPSDRLFLRDTWGLPDSMLSELESLAMAGPHCGEAVRDRRALLVPDFREIALFYSLRLDVARPDWQSYLCVPLVAEDEIQGVVCLFSKAPAVFDGDQLAFFEALGQQVGVAIQNARYFEEARAWRERLQALSRRLVELQEAERQHIARELHDEIGQVLTGLKLTLEMTASSGSDGGSESLNEALLLVNQLMGQVRQLSLDLRPSMLDDLGLAPALRWLFDRFEAQTSIAVVFESAGLEGRFPTAIETAAYRIIQEALTNVARHAQVSEVVVRVRADSRGLSLEVQDEGIGFNPETTSAATSGCGLTGMRERTALLGGAFRIESAPGAGTLLAAELPLPDPVSQEGELG